MAIFKRILEEYGYFSKKSWTPKETGDFWDKTVDYDEINKKTSSYFRRFLDAFALSEMPDRSYVLDICSRTGNGALYFWQKGKVQKAVCADVSPEMQKICHKVLSEAGVDFKTVLFDSFPLPFPDGEFEAILCFESIEHFSDPKTMIKELSRVTKKGSEVVITTPNVLWEPFHSIAAILGIHHSEGPHRFIRAGKIRRFIKEAGLEIIKEETTVLVPIGPKSLVRFGEWLEKKTRNSLMPILGLRRIFICAKQ